MTSASAKVNPSDSRIGVKEAVQRARKHLLSLYEGEEIYDVRLEEVETTEDGKRWLVTYGFNVPDVTARNPLIPTDIVSRKMKRDYKVIAIDARTGEPLSMKIRAL